MTLEEIEAAINAVLKEHNLLKADVFVKTTSDWEFWAKRFDGHFNLRKEIFRNGLVAVSIYQVCTHDLYVFIDSEG